MDHPDRLLVDGGAGHYGEVMDAKARHGGSF
jgi:hypothetical protein